ncbi:MAG TPA: hypothetical protein VFG68_13220 [Fimbriiglobus sp.]|nr:hypothetical protein [Fimbriiglobus sp.]
MFPLSSANCIVDTDAVYRLQIFAAYTGDLTLATPTFTVIKSLNLNNGVFRKAATVTGNAQLLLDDVLGVGATGTILTAEFHGVDLVVGGSGDSQASLTIRASITQPLPVAFDSAVLYNYDILDWQGNTIALSGHATIDNYGIADILGNAAFTDNPFPIQRPTNSYCYNNYNLTTFIGGSPIFLSVQNTGEMVVRTNTKFSGNYYSAGTTEVRNTTLELAGKAEQVGGTFILADSAATVKPSGQGNVLNIYDGSIVGTGKVDGNLTLGVDPNGGDPFGGMWQPSPVINPGFAGAAQGDPPISGTLTITQSFEMFSYYGTPVCTMLIDVTASGGYDKVAVTGWAHLSGALRLNPSPVYKPMSGTRLDFLTSGSFEGTDFDEATSTYWGSWAEPGSSNPVKPVKWTLTKTASTYSLLAELIVGSGPPGGGS